jgi:hypothetical protein
MSDKKQRDYSNRGGEHNYNPGEEVDLGKEADVKQPPKGWEDGFEVTDIQPEFPKVKSSI